MELPHVSHIAHTEAVHGTYAGGEAHEGVENIATKHALRFGNRL